MRIGIVGSGIVGQVLGRKLVELGHEVLIGTRDPSKLEEKKGRAGTLGEWVASTGGKGKVSSFAEAAAHGEIVVNATEGVHSIAALRSAGEANLGGKVLVDISNALDFSQGMPPRVLVDDKESLAEQIQRAFPAARVVKTLNTMNAFVMVNPALVPGGDSTVFLSGNDEGPRPR
jgi:predicted dinucleotide-binding enzyme